MKKIISLFLLPILCCFMFSASSSASIQTKILKPTTAELGLTKVSLVGSQPGNIDLGGGGTDLNSAILEDGQFALLDPTISGPGDEGSTSSLLFLDYDKDAICSGATISQVKVFAKWYKIGESTSSEDYAILLEADYDGSTPYLEVTVNSDTAESNFISKIYGGLVPPFPGFTQTFSGNAPSTLTLQSGSSAVTPTLEELKGPNTRIVISLGNQGSLGDSQGFLDTAYLEVTYDDSNCSPDGIDPSTIAPPKTGAALTAGIIVAALLALAGASFFGVKRTKLKHRVSERE